MNNRFGLTAAFTLLLAISSTDHALAFEPVSCQDNGNDPMTCDVVRHWSSINDLTIVWSVVPVSGCYRFDEQYSPTDNRKLHICNQYWDVLLFNVEFTWSQTYDADAWSGLYESELGYINASYRELPLHGGGNTRTTGLPPIEP